MNISRSARLLAFLAPLVMVLTAAATLYFGHLRMEGNRERLRQEVRQPLEALADGRHAIRRYAAQQRDVLLEQVMRIASDSLAQPGYAPNQPVQPAAFLDSLEMLGLERRELKPLKDAAADLQLAGKRTQTAVQNLRSLQDSAGLAAVEEAVLQRLAQARDAALAEADKLAAGLNSRRTGLQAERAANQQAVFMALAAGVLLELLVVILLMVSFAKSIHQPLRRMLGRLKKRGQLDPPPNELGQLARHINRLHEEEKLSAQLLQQLSQGDYLLEIPEEKLPESLEGTIAATRDQLRQLDKDLRERRQAVETLEQKLAAKTDELEQARKDFETTLANHRKGMVFAELTPEGRIRSVNKHFLKASGFTWNGLEHSTLGVMKSDHTTEKDLERMVDGAKGGRPWSGMLKLRAKDGSYVWLTATLTQVESPEGDKRLQFAGLEVSELKDAEQRAKNELQQKERQVRNLQQQQQSLLGEQQQLQQQLGELKQAYDKQNELEYRLVQQQSGIQELTRNQSLKEGNVREAMRSVTETTAYTLEEDRAGVWLFARNDSAVRCIDLYDRNEMSHAQGFEMNHDDLALFFEAVMKPEVLPLEDASKDDRGVGLYSIYLQSQDVRSILTAPVRLGGRVVGFLMVEHAGEAREWPLDEQNFLFAVGDIVSLALEQGNRRTMEEELRMTLEESQALEEELRQNAEEIEATNEEMRRTQIELRGQISALNNSAIVSETNLEGEITYVNPEFTKIYGLDGQKVLGKNHRLIKADYHTPEFFKTLWETILAGKVWRGEIMNRATDGTDIWVSLSITPVLGLDGRPYKFIGVGFDISQQKDQEKRITEALHMALQQKKQLRQSASQLEESNAEMRRTQLELHGQINALNNSSMVFETDAEGNITYANDELLTVSGFSREELLGQSYGILSANGQNRRTLEKQWETVQEGEIWKGELELKAKGGETFWGMVTNTPVLDETGTVAKSINVIIDITEQKNQEFRLKKQQAALVDLTRHPAIKEGNIEEAAHVITKEGMDTLSVSRVAVWMYEDNDQRVRCLSEIDAEGTHSHTQGTVLERSMFPNYFQSLELDHIIATSEALEDDRTADLAFNLLKPQGISGVIDVSIRYGAKTVGLLSIEHKGPRREWTVDEISFTTSLADTLGMALEQRAKQQADKLKEAYEQLEDANKAVTRQKAELEQTTQWLKESIRYAKRIQQNILPEKEEMETYLGNFFIVFRPKDIVGGDFYWFSAVDDDTRVVIVADGTGHGVPGAFLTLIGYLLLNQIVNEKGITKPSDILYDLHLGVRSALKQDEEESTSRDGMDLNCITINMQTHELQFAGANNPVYIYQDWEIHEVKATKKAIGGEQLEEERTFENHTFQLKTGDAIYMYTDGFVDQLGGPEEKRFGKRRFRDLVLRTQHESMKTQRALLNLEWKDWKGDGEQLDDVTVFGLKL